MKKTQRKVLFLSIILIVCQIFLVSCAGTPAWAQDLVRDGNFIMGDGIEWGMDHSEVASLLPGMRDAAINDPYDTRYMKMGDGSHMLTPEAVEWSGISQPLKVSYQTDTNGKLANITITPDKPVLIPDLKTVQKNVRVLAEALNQVSGLEIDVEEMIAEGDADDFQFAVRHWFIGDTCTQLLYSKGGADGYTFTLALNGPEMTKTLRERFGS